MTLVFFIATAVIKYRGNPLSGRVKYMGWENAIFDRN